MAQTAGALRLVRAAGRHAREFRRFLAAGATTTLLDYVLFVGVARITGLPLEWVWVAKVISGTVAIAISFYLNRVWVFRAAQASLGQAVRFVTTVAVGVYLIQTPLTQVFTASYPEVGEIAFDLLQRAGVGLVSEELVIKTVAFVLATVPTLAFNFLLYRFWVFPPRTSQ